MNLLLLSTARRFKSNYMPIMTVLEPAISPEIQTLSPKALTVNPKPYMSLDPISS